VQFVSHVSARLRWMDAPFSSSSRAPDPGREAEQPPTSFRWLYLLSRGSRQFVVPHMWRQWQPPNPVRHTLAGGTVWCWRRAPEPPGMALRREPASAVPNSCKGGLAAKLFLDNSLQACIPSVSHLSARFRWLDAPFSSSSRAPDPGQKRSGKSAELFWVWPTYSLPRQGLPIFKYSCMYDYNF